MYLVFHKNNPGNRFNMRTQFYMPLEWFDLAARPAAPAPLAESPSWEESQESERGVTGKNRFKVRSDLLLGLGIVGLFFFFIMKSKHRSMVTARKGLEEITAEMHQEKGKKGELAHLAFKDLLERWPREKGYHIITNSENGPWEEDGHIDFYIGSYVWPPCFG